MSVYAYIELNISRNGERTPTIFDLITIHLRDARIVCACVATGWKCICHFDIDVDLRFKLTLRATHHPLTPLPPHGKTHMTLRGNAYGRRIPNGMLSEIYSDR